jgi:hypothetical protein
LLRTKGKPFRNTGLARCLFEFGPYFSREETSADRSFAAPVSLPFS